jgi:peptidoglycan hydrolase-like protein with peptidoglycan-binding domain
MKPTIASRLAAIVGLLIGTGILAVAAAPASAFDEPVTHTLAQGVGMGAKPDADVRGLQQALQYRGYRLGPAGVDGRFGPVTAAAVMSLQRSFGLVSDGIVGPKTRKLLRFVCKTDRCASANQARSPAPARGTPAPVSRRRHAAQEGGLGWSGLATVGAALLALVLIGIAYGWGSNASSRQRSTPPPRVVGYVAAGGTPFEGAAGASQEAAIEAECERRGWTLLDVFREVGGGERDALAYALERIGAGEASCLMVGDLDSFGGTTADVGRLLERLADLRAELVALEPGIDTSTREGALAASVILTLSRREAAQAATRARSNAMSRSHAWDWEASMN